MIGFNVRLPRCPARLNRAARPRLDVLEVRSLLSTSAVKLTASTQYPTSVLELPPGTIGYDPSNPSNPSAKPNPDQLLTTSDVKALLERAAAAVDLNDAIIAVVDRNGTILGVRVESGVSPLITGNTTNLVFAIDGAVSEARTGAYFANDTAPLTSRTIQEISQTTITQRVVDSNPDVRGRNHGTLPPGHHVPTAGRSVRHRGDQS
jgi:hypothetical protein